jgi:hypothetical protein
MLWSLRVCVYICIAVPEVTRIDIQMLRFYRQGYRYQHCVGKEEFFGEIRNLVRIGRWLARTSFVGSSSRGAGQRWGPELLPGMISCLHALSITVELVSFVSPFRSTVVPLYLLLTQHPPLLQAPNLLFDAWGRRPHADRRLGKLWPGLLAATSTGGGGRVDDVCAGRCGCRLA